jgi:hypothetical protein
MIVGDSSQVPETDNQQCRELLANVRRELLERQFSNSQAYDKAILTLSSAFLALSLNFMKDVLPSGGARHLGLLYTSWILLACAIAGTVVSFRISDAAANSQLRRAERYYLEGDESALNRTTLSRSVEWVNNAAGILFLAGVFIMVAFTILNFWEAGSMSGKTYVEPIHIESGRSIPTMQKAAEGVVKRGQSIPPIQKVPQGPTAKPAQPEAAPTSSPPGAGSDGPTQNK